jgi:hypothetical protein
MGVWGHAPPGKFKIFQPPRLFLVASETRLSGLERSLLVISTGSPPFQRDGGCVSSHMDREAEDNLWARNDPIEYFHHSNFYMYMHCVYGWWQLSGGGGGGDTQPSK